MRGGSVSFTVTCGQIKCGRQGWGPGPYLVRYKHDASTHGARVVRNEQPPSEHLLMRLQLGQPHQCWDRHD